MKKIVVIYALLNSTLLFAADVAQTIATKGPQSVLTGKIQGDQATGGGAAGCVPIGKGAVCVGGNLSGGAVSGAGIGGAIRVTPNAALGVGVSQNNITGERNAAVGTQFNFGSTKPK